MILVDTGAGSSSLISQPPLSSLAILAVLPHPPFSLSRPDVYFEGCGPANSTIRIAIEVKHLTEFAASLDTGRLQATQMPALLYLADIRWLLILTGMSRRNPLTGVLQTRQKIKNSWEWLDWSPAGRTIPYSYLDRFLMSPSFCNFTDESGVGIRHDRVFGKKEAAQWIVDLYKVWQKPYHRHTSTRVLDRSGNQNGLTDRAVSSSLKARFASSSFHDPRFQDPGFAQRVRTASSLPGVSYTRAVALAETFASSQEILSPACTCRGREGIEEEEETRWAAVRTTDAENGKTRRLGPSLAGEIGRMVRK